MVRGLFQGVGTALVTPFNDDMSVNYNKVEELVDWQIEQGVDALIICGTTGEASALPDDEHIQVVKTAVKAASGRVPIIAGSGSNDTIHGINLAKALTKAGANALLSVTPYYNKTNQDGLIKHFEANAAASDLPLILYNVPSRTNVNIAPETYYKLAKIENILAIKECNLNQIAKTRQLCGDAYIHYSGEDGLITPSLALGAKGVISVLSNIMPKEVHSICQYWFDGNIEQAISDQISKSRIIELLFSDVSPMPVKFALNFLGHNVGPCRLPLSEISESLKDKLILELENFS